MDYAIWDKLSRAINWKKVESKATLIDELNRVVEKIWTRVAFGSCVP